MLVKKFNKDDIVTLKIISGEEYVAKIVEDNEKEYIVSKPMLVIPQQQGLGLLQGVLTAEPEGNMPMSKSNIILFGYTEPNVKAHYIKITTGIDVAPPPPGSNGGIIT